MLHQTQPILCSRHSHSLLVPHILQPHLPQGALTAALAAEFLHLEKLPETWRLGNILSKYWQRNSEAIRHNDM